MLCSLGSSTSSGWLPVRRTARRHRDGRGMDDRELTRRASSAGHDSARQLTPRWRRSPGVQWSTAVEDTGILCGSDCQRLSFAARLRRRTGPCRSRPERTAPRCTTSISCRSAISAVTDLTSSMWRRHPGPPITRAASERQMVRSGSRCRASAAIAASARVRRLSSSGSSHHGAPRSPNAILAACTRCRAIPKRSPSSARFATPTSRRADINSSTSSCRNVSGTEGSVLLQRRPPIVIHRASSSTRGHYPQ